MSLFTDTHLERFEEDDEDSGIDIITSTATLIPKGPRVRFGRDRVKIVPQNTMKRERDAAKRTEAESLEWASASPYQKIVLARKSRLREALRTDPSTGMQDLRGGALPRRNASIDVPASSSCATAPTVFFGIEIECLVMVPQEFFPHLHAGHVFDDHDSLAVEPMSGAYLYGLQDLLAYACASRVQIAACHQDDEWWREFLHQTWRLCRDNSVTEEVGPYSLSGRIHHGNLEGLLESEGAVLFPCCELVSPVYRDVDRAHIPRALQFDHGIKMITNPTSSTHMHVSCESLTSVDGLLRLIGNWCMFEAVIMLLCDPVRIRSHFCRPIPLVALAGSLLAKDPELVSTDDVLGLLERAPSDLSIHDLCMRAGNRIDKHHSLNIDPAIDLENRPTGHVEVRIMHGYTGQNDLERFLDLMCRFVRASAKDATAADLIRSSARIRAFSATKATHAYDVPMDVLGELASALIDWLAPCGDDASEASWARDTADAFERALAAHRDRASLRIGDGPTLVDVVLATKEIQDLIDGLTERDVRSIRRELRAHLRMETMNTASHSWSGIIRVCALFAGLNHPQASTTFQRVLTAIDDAEYVGPQDEETLRKTFLPVFTSFKSIVLP